MRKVTLILVPFVVLTGCSKKEEAATPTPVKTSAVTLQDVRETWTYSGEVRPKTEVKLAFKQGGYVASLYQVRATQGGTRDVQPGDRVPAGATLARLRTGELAASVDSASGQLTAAEGQLSSAQADLEAAKSDQKKSDLAFQRAEQLYAAKARTRPDYDSAVGQHNDGLAKTQSSIDQIKARQGQLQAMQAQIKSAKIALTEANLTILKPSVVISKEIEVGSLVSAGTTGFTVADTRTMDVEFGVPDSILSQVVMGEELPVSIESLHQQFVGHVTEVAAAANSDSRVFKIKVSVPNRAGALKVGMIGRVKIEQAGGGRKLPVLPMTALISAQSGSNGYSVFVVSDEDGKQVAHLRSLRTGQIIERSIVIENGLYPGERVILERTNQLADGSIVSVEN